MMTDDLSFADDLVQQTLLQAWTHRDESQDDISSTYWLFQILRTLYYADPRRLNALTAPRDPPSLAQLPVDGDTSTMRLAQIRLALAKLSEQHREVLILVGASGFDYEEVSLILGCPLGTVKSRLARARKGLERVLEEWSAAAVEHEEESGESRASLPSQEIH